jgi:transposase
VVLRQALMLPLDDFLSVVRKFLQPERVYFAELQVEIAVEVDVMNAHITARSELDRKIEALYADLQPDDVLRTIPGVGRRLAPVLFFPAPQRRSLPGRTPHPRLLWPVPVPFGSGGSERPRQRITQGGNNRIERALTLSALLDRLTQRRHIIETKRQLPLHGEFSRSQKKKEWNPPLTHD